MCVVCCVGERACDRALSSVSAPCSTLTHLHFAGPNPTRPDGDLPPPPSPPHTHSTHTAASQLEAVHSADARVVSARDYSVLLHGVPRTLPAADLRQWCSHYGSCEWRRCCALICLLPAVLSQSLPRVQNNVALMPPRLGVPPCRDCLQWLLHTTFPTLATQSVWQTACRHFSSGRWMDGGGGGGWMCSAPPCIPSSSSSTLAA